MGSDPGERLTIRGRKVVEDGPVYRLREPQVSCSAHFGLENDDIGSGNVLPQNVAGSNDFSRLCQLYV